jgi:hypothetical protein
MATAICKKIFKEAKSTFEPARRSPDDKAAPDKD